MSGPSSRPVLDRRAVAKALSRCANATVRDVLADGCNGAAGRSARRIGITGAPGAGKSTLISQLVRHRAEKAEWMGVLAIDPTSPFSGGAILGDRVRMDNVVQNDGVFIRSFASRSAHDGLTDNVAGLLGVMDRHAFDEVILETVGVGQTDYAVRVMVDTLILILTPESGDYVQAMKAGLMETADIYVINKADRPNARQVANDVRAVLARTQASAGWRPSVLEASSHRPDSVEELSRAIDLHQQWFGESQDQPSIMRKRRARQIAELVRRRVDELIDHGDTARFDRPLSATYAEIVSQLQKLPEDK
jgi:LAO/AO transport system kinase